MYRKECVEIFKENHIKRKSLFKKKKHLGESFPGEKLIRVGIQA